VLDGIRVATVHPNGSIRARGVNFNVSYPLRGQDVFLAYEPDTLMVFDDRGTLIIEHNWPPPGVKYVGNGKPRGPRGRGLSPMS
jgi:putative transposase